MTTIDYFYIDGEEFEVEHFDTLAFLYSENTLSIFGSYSEGFWISATNLSTGKRYVEHRNFFDNYINMDLSGIMQQVAQDPTEVLGSSFPYVPLRVAIEDDRGEAWFSYEVTGIYGARNAGEPYRFSKSPDHRRLWVNYPQTFSLFNDADDHQHYKLADGFKIYAKDEAPDRMVLEDDLLASFDAFQSAESSGAARSLRAGSPLVVGLSTRKAITADAEGIESSMGLLYWLKLVPDLTPRHAPGRTYLRWLQRDGSFGYWLLHTGDIQVTSATRRSFIRHYYDRTITFMKNPRQADFTESRVLTLSATASNEEEFEYVSGLLTSPVVDRMITIEGRDGLVDKWERVNVLPSTQAYSKKFNTPRRRQLDITIQLPDRDTITL